MNKGVAINLEHWVQIIALIPEISSADRNRNRTTDKKILSPAPICYMLIQ
jgi:hypothetical protein